MNTHSDAPTGVILEEVDAEPAAIRETVDRVRPAVGEIGAELGGAGLRRVLLVGNGTSLYSCELAAAWWSAKADAHAPCAIVRSAGEMLHHPPSLGDGDVVVALSASGEQRDVLAVAEALHGRVPVVAVTQNADGSLAERADHVVEAAGGPGSVPVMTKTFASTATATVLTAIGLVAGDALDASARLLRDAGDRAESAIEAARADAATAALRVRELGLAHGFVFGTGAGATAAREAALKLKEVSLLHAEGDETWEVESGASTIIGKGSLAIAMRTQGADGEATARLARLSGEWGAHVVEVAPTDSPWTSQLLRIPEDTTHLVAPLVCVPPVVMLAYHLAVAQGLDPDRPGWTARYAAQGLNHVVGAEEA